MNLEMRIVQALDKLNNLIKNFDKAKADKMNLSISQLKKIINDLERMKSNMNPKDFYPTYGHMIIDSWNPEEEIELSDELLKIKNAYNKI
ncbi:MAG: hypothetical protein L6428_10490 [Candidatus Aminicenantes bacterium]|nr:hypothetical protein [Acidobacteriota bacterium]MCG2811871.1 hypothetical protein [Candidatus Aminicenantes bacterium]